MSKGWSTPRFAALIAIAILALGPTLCAILMSQAEAVPALSCCHEAQAREQAPAQGENPSPHTNCPVYKLSLLHFFGTHGEAAPLAAPVVLWVLAPMLTALI